MDSSSSQGLAKSPAAPSSLAAAAAAAAPASGCVYRVVLTGGPCAGKTTAQAKMAEFFSNLGWTVYTTPETATVLLRGGVNFAEMSANQQADFQENLVKTMRQIEKTFFDMAALEAKEKGRRTLVLCDRGLLDASAYVDASEWDRMLKANAWNNVELRDARYDHIVHMVSAADGAESFYQTANNTARTEGLALARDLDRRTQDAWVGHPYVDVVDNSTTFDEKLQRAIDAVCHRFRVPVENPRRKGMQKRKYLLKSGGTPLLKGGGIPVAHQTFEVEHFYLLTTDGSQARVRRRTQRGASSYQHTIRHHSVSGAGGADLSHETRIPIGVREFQALTTQRDPAHANIYKTRSVFLWQRHYFQLDVYTPPAPPQCADLVLLETYVEHGQSEVNLPPWIAVQREVTGLAEFSMYNLSRVDTTTTTTIGEKKTM